MEIITTHVKSSFANFTLVNRIPSVIQQIIKQNNLTDASNVSAILLGIPNDKLVPIDDYKCASERKGYIDIINKEIISNEYHWNNAPFLLLENYLYHKLAELTAKDGIIEDYFAHIKQSAVDNSLDKIKSTYLLYQKLFVLEVNEALPLLLQLNLMGNKADLSQSKETYNAGESDNYLLIDKSEQVIKLIPDLKRVDIILDNSGEELFADLLMAHWLLNSTQVCQVVLHFKTMPYFVSDAMFSDYEYLLKTLKSSIDLKPFANEIELMVNEGCILLKQDDFWCSNELFNNIPQHLKVDLSNSDLLIFKGDLNYRKLVDDRSWDCTIPTQNIVNYLPTDILILRILKSEVIVGLSEHNIPSISDNKWKYNGEYGIIEYCNSPKLGS